MQVEMLGVVLLQPARSWTLEELSATLGATRSSVHRELGRALAAGIIVRNERQRPHLHSAATESPAYRPLCELLELTVGVREQLRSALADVPGVVAASMHGSWASGRVRADSDIDVIVVSAGQRRAVVRAARAVGRGVGREVDATVLRVEEFRDMLGDGNPFLTQILNGPRIDLVGHLDQVITDD